MNHTLTWTGAEAMEMKYAVGLVCSKCPELSAMSDNEIISLLIDRALDREGEA